MNQLRRPVDLVIAGALIALALAACDRRAQGEGGDLSPETGATPPAPTDTPPSDPASGTATASTASSAVPSVPELAEGDRAFLRDVGRANEEEIATTQLGMSHGNEASKKLSSMLYADHVALRDQVAKIAPMLPTQSAAAPAALQSVRGPEFDGLLLDTYRKQHEDAIRKFEAASRDTSLSEPVRSLVSATLPKLKAHLDAVTQAKSAR